MNDVYLTDKQVGSRYGISRPSVWRWVKKGIIPGPVKFSEGCSRWVKNELDACDAERMKNRAS